MPLNHDTDCWLKWDNQAIWYFPNMTSNPVQTNSWKEPVDAGIQTIWSSILNYEPILITFNFSSTCHVQAISYQQLVDGDWVPCWLPSIPTPACQCYSSIRSPEFLLPTKHDMLLLMWLQDSIKFVQEVVLEDRAKLKGIPSDCSQLMVWQYSMPSSQ